MKSPYIPPAPTQMAAGQERLWLSIIAEKLNLLVRRANALPVTLTPSAATTTLYDERLSPYASLHLAPTSASAASATGLWIELGNGVATIHHDISTATDRSFRATVVG